jgi:hypothetical protein
MNVKRLLPYSMIVLSVLASVAAAADLPQGAPADEGFAIDLGDKVDAIIARDEFENIHSVVVARGGKIVLERYQPAMTSGLTGP